MKRKRILITTLIIAAAGMAGMQFIRPEIPVQPVTGDLEAPPEVKEVLTRACYDCHSNDTKLHWFDQVSPVYWRVAAHVKAGRAGLNVSEWDKLAPGDRKAKLWEAVNQIAAGAMPLKDYEFVHGDSKVSARDLAVLKKWMAGMIKDKPADTAIINAAQKQKAGWHPQTVEAKQPVALNDITYIPDYKNWRAISTTERMDNGTMRVILGNDVDVKAVRSGQVNPWPDGTIFAQVAWDQLEDKDGNVSTGAFKQIESMIQASPRSQSPNG